MTQIRNSQGQIVANVAVYQGAHRSGTESAVMPSEYIGRHSRMQVIREETLSRLVTPSDLGNR